MSERLFAVHNAFFLGAFQQAVNEGHDLVDLDDAATIERDFYSYRSYVALGQCELVLSEVTDDSPTALQGVRLLAQYLSGGDKESIMAKVNELLSDAMTASNPMVAVMAATLHMSEGNYEEALRACSATSSLEMHAVMIQSLLKIERVDLAEKQLRLMQAVDDDATLTQLCVAWVNINLGGLKVQEAYYVYQELGEKFTWTARLYNGSAACNMAMGRFDEAEKDLMEALSKDSKDADTLANLVACGLHLGKPSAQRYLSQLKATHADHFLTKRVASMDAAFDRACTNLG